MKRLIFNRLEIVEENDLIRIIFNISGETEGFTENEIKSYISSLVSNFNDITRDDLRYDYWRGVNIGCDIDITISANLRP